MPTACCPGVFENSCILVAGTACKPECDLGVSEPARHLKTLLLEARSVNQKMEVANRVFSVALGKVGANTSFLFCSLETQ